MEDQEIINEFLIESNENLARLDQEMVQLEQRPKDAELLASIFRSVHTVKGTCGFLGFTKLEAITHQAESILSQLRNGERDLTRELVSLILEAVDAMRKLLAAIEATGSEGEESHEELCQRLEAAGSQVSGPAEQVAASESEQRVEASGAPGPESALARNSKDPTPGIRLPIEAEQQEEARLEGDIQTHLRTSSVADSTIRVDVSLLDTLMNLVGELVLTRNQILQFNAKHEDTTLNTTSQRLNLITTELQEGVMKTRMQPIGVIWNKFPRVVRDLGNSFGKQIILEMDGAETELDRTIIEAIKDPLTHIVRNCSDHGIERPEVRAQAGKSAQGKLTLRAFHEGGQVNIEISDDGAGIDIEKVKRMAIQKGLIRSDYAKRMGDREAVNLIFHPGFSTAESVTNVSGRGVGMDVVKTNIEKIGGTVDLLSRPGEGTTVKVKIPLTLAIIPGLLVTSGGELFVIPQVSLLELIRLEGEAVRNQIEQIHGTPVYRRRGRLLPIAYLNRVIGLEDAGQPDIVNIVVLQAEDRQFGLVVDGISDTQEIVVKPLGKQLKGLSSYAGATIMGDGRVALILDVLGIGQLSGVVTETGEQALGEQKEEPKENLDGDRQTLLLFRSGSFERLAVPLAVVARLEEFQQSQIESAGGRQVVQYRGRILPLASLSTVLESGADAAASRRNPVQAIVFDNQDRSVGILVDQILDIVEETVITRQPAARPGLLGSAVVGGKVTDFIDLHAVVDQAAGDWFAGSRQHHASSASVLVAEGSASSRAMVRSYLEMAGYQVLEASSVETALHQLEHRRVGMVLAAIDLPARESGSLPERMLRLPDLARVPVLALTNTAEDARQAKQAGLRFEGYALKSDREAMLCSVQKLILAVGAEATNPALVTEEA